MEKELISHIEKIDLNIQSKEAENQAMISSIDESKAKVLSLQEKKEQIDAKVLQLQEEFQKIEGEANSLENDIEFAKSKAKGMISKSMKARVQSELGLTQLRFFSKPPL